jgi:hypothetical protein
MAPYRTYAIAMRIRRGALPDALYWDTLDPYHYVRVQPGDRETDFVIVGGADHKTGEANDADVRFQALEAWARNLIPKLDGVSHRWSGQVLDTIEVNHFLTGKIEQMIGQGQRNRLALSNRAIAAFREYRRARTIELTLVSR